MQAEHDQYQSWSIFGAYCRWRLAHYGRLGSILVSITFFAELVIFESMGSYRVSTPNRIQFYALGAILMCMAIWRHRSNIGRLLSGTENKLGAKKS